VGRNGFRDDEALEKAVKVLLIKANPEFSLPLEINAEGSLYDKTPHAINIRSDCFIIFFILTILMIGFGLIHILNSNH